MAYGTDGPVAALGLVTLEDSKGVQPIYAPTPVIRSDALARQPAIARWLDPVFRSLTSSTLSPGSMPLPRRKAATAATWRANSAQVIRCQPRPRQ